MNFPIFLVWLATNIGPLALIAYLYINFDQSNSMIKEITLLVVLYIFFYFIIYLIGSFLQFNLARAPLTSGDKQALLHFFSIARTAIVIIPVVILAFFFIQKPKVLLLIACGIELIIVVYHFIKRRLRAHN